MDRHAPVFGVLALVSLAGAAMAQPAPAQTPIVEGAAAQALARRLGIPVRYDAGSGWGSGWGAGTQVLERFEHGRPIYIGTDNEASAHTIRTDRVRMGGDLEFNLCGCGIELGIWEAGSGVRATHHELADRVTQVDAAAPSTDHATHVAGTMIATGVQLRAMGMAFAASLKAFDAANDIDEMRTQARDHNLRISNHSYSPRYGWEARPNVVAGVHWVYGPGIDAAGAFVGEDAGFGRYNQKAQRYDRVMNDNPRYLAFLSASNQNGLRPAAGQRYRVWNASLTPPAWQVRTIAAADPGANGTPQGGYDTIPAENTCKNGVTVGNVEQIATYEDAASVVLAATSGVGPTDDGRIKPDVVAGGQNVYSSVLYRRNADGTRTARDDQYGSLSGTSMATPAVSGSAGLILEQWRHTRGWERPDPLSSTIRALLIHTADEAGPADGPDYRFGWGLVNTTQAVRAVRNSNDEGYTLVAEERLMRDTDADWEMTVYTDAYDEEFKVTIAWVDPEGTPAAGGLNDRTRMLVHDLDLRVTDIVSGQEYRPWTLDPANPSRAATTGDNIRDNVEQVVVKGFDAYNHRAWRIRVTHKGELTRGQRFSLVMTGAYQRFWCVADYNRDEFVDLFDYKEFLAEFEDGSLMADLNGDHMVDLFDYQMFVEAFERGC